MSRARVKGTQGENFFRDLLRPLFPGVDRAPLRGTLDQGDLTGVPWLHECKSTATPRFLDWAETAERKSPGKWAVLWKGDLRRKARTGPYVVVPIELYMDMAWAWNIQHYQPSTKVDL